MPTVEVFREDYPDLAAPYTPAQIQRRLDAAALWLRGFPWETTDVGRNSYDYASYLIAAHELEYRRLQMAASSGTVNSVATGNGGQVASVGEWWSLSVYGAAFNYFQERVEQQAREEMLANEDGEYELSPGHGFSLRPSTDDIPVVLGVNYGYSL
jgi:hypothetical protein